MVYYPNRKFNGKLYDFLLETDILLKAQKQAISLDRGNFVRIITAKKLGKSVYRVYYRRKTKLSDFKRPYDWSEYDKKKS